MAISTWDGFFTRGVLGGLAFWLNLFLFEVLRMNLNAKAKVINLLCNTAHKIDGNLAKSGLELVVNWGIIALIAGSAVFAVGYILEQIAFFFMKTMNMPCKWYYDFAACGGEKAEELEILHDHKIKNKSWLNRVRLMIINLSIVYGLWLSTVAYLLIQSKPQFILSALVILGLLLLVICCFKANDYWQAWLSKWFRESNIYKCITITIILVSLAICVYFGCFTKEYLISVAIMFEIGVSTILICEAEQLNRLFGKFIYEVIEGNISGK